MAHTRDKMGGRMRHAMRDQMEHAQSRWSDAPSVRFDGESDASAKWSPVVPRVHCSCSWHYHAHATILMQYPTQSSIWPRHGMPHAHAHCPRTNYLHHHAPSHQCSGGKLPLTAVRIAECHLPTAH